MKTNTLVQIVAQILLGGVILGLACWAIFFLESNTDKIAVFAIVAAVLATFTSIWTVSLNNRKAKEREYELHILKEKQLVYKCFYESFVMTVLSTKVKGDEKASRINEAEKKIMEFRKGLMNWGSERLIAEYYKYDDEILASQGSAIFTAGNRFMREIRKDLGFSDSETLQMVEMLFNAEARRDLNLLSKG